MLGRYWRARSMLRQVPSSLEEYSFAMKLAEEETGGLAADWRLTASDTGSKYVTWDMSLCYLSIKVLHPATQLIQRVRIWMVRFGAQSDDLIGRWNVRRSTNKIPLFRLEGGEIRPILGSRANSHISLGTAVGNNFSRHPMHWTPLNLDFLRCFWHPLPSNLVCLYRLLCFPPYIASNGPCLYCS